MTSDELVKDSRATFPSLKKPFFGRDVIECRDQNYDPGLPHDVYLSCLDEAWAEMEAVGIEYGPTFPDCDDYADIQKGLFKLKWSKAIKDGKIPKGSAPVLASVMGYNPYGENHAYLYFRSDKGRFIRDYGSTLPPGKYEPMRMNF
jgi:hypothetical protein